MAIELLEPAWAEFSDLAETEAGAGLMLAFARAYSGKDESELSIQWGERASIVGERLDLMEIVVRSLNTRGSSLIGMNRSIEGMILIRGAVELAQSHGLLEVESRLRVIGTFVAQWDDPRAGLESARAGQVVAQRLGSRFLSEQMVGNGSICAFRVGDWDWAVALLQEWAAVDLPPANRLEFTVDQAILDALRGNDPAPAIDSMESLLADLTDPQFQSYRSLAIAWAALASGRLQDAQRAARLAVETTPYFAPLAWPLAARAALWEGDVAALRELLVSMRDERSRGQALSADQLTLGAGLAALEGREAEALATYREAMRAWQGLGLEWDEALCAIDMTSVLDPAEPEVQAAADRARAILTRLGAKPMLERLASAVSSNRLTAPVR
jgi:tetratricopeptide (TPR) repeat protein